MNNLYVSQSVGFLLIFTVLILTARTSLALDPAEVAIIANSEAANSLSLAEYYMQRRHIPEENLIIVQTTWNEVTSRDAYEQEILGPIKDALRDLMIKKRIRCLVVMYGIPLKIQPLKLDLRVEEELSQLKQKLVEEQQETKESTDKKEILNTHQEVTSLKSKIRSLQQLDARASVDSELALVLQDEYPLAGWLPNPYFLGFKDRKTLLARDQVLLVSRLDGPNPDIVRRIIDHSVAIEAEGLQGMACFDARWPRPKGRPQNGYASYDNAIHQAAELLREDGEFVVISNDKAELFSVGECPNPALYCGWYSLAKYVDVFDWAPGSIGYHIASNECSTLKKEGSQTWCKRMLEDGITATIGPVYEPYVQAFPPPDIFFSNLSEGYLSLGEVYLISLPFLSWQMVLIGDPLYQPFKPK